MAGSTAPETTVRLLGLGNEIMGDDAFGILVAGEIRRRFGETVEVVCSSAAGFDLLEHVLDTPRLLVVDTVVTGQSPPGTLHVINGELAPSPGVCSAHGAGLFEVLAAARLLGLRAPGDVVVIAVEAVSCYEVGGPMHPQVRAAISEAVQLVAGIVAGRPQGERIAGTAWPIETPGA